MHVVTIEQALTFAGGIDEAGRPLPRVARQIHELASDRELLAEINRARKQHSATQVLQCVKAVMATFETGEYLPRRRIIAARLEHIIQIAAQNRMCTNFDQEAMTTLGTGRITGCRPGDQFADRGLE